MEPRSRHPQCLAAIPSPVAPRNGDEAGVVGVGVEPGDVRRRPLEKLADLVPDEELVREATDRRQVVAPGLRSAAGHHHELVPLEDPGFVLTDMNREWLADPEVLKGIESRTPLGRVGAPFAWTASIVHDFTGVPFTSTAHEPQLVVSHPMCVPVRPSV